MSNAGMRAIIDDAEIDLNAEPCYIFAESQNLKAGGHCLRMNQGVTCNGFIGCPFSKFKVFPGIISAEKKTVCVIQSIANNLVLAVSDNKVCAKYPNFDYSKKDQVINIEDIDVETLFERVAHIKLDPTHYSFRLRSNENKVIGFDANGAAISPDDVKIEDPESLFTVIKCSHWDSNN